MSNELEKSPANARRLHGNKKLSGLQAAADGRLIVQVLSTEFPFQVLLFSPYDDIVDQRHRPDECSQQPHAVDPDRDTELEHGERQIDRVPAEAIRARADDHGGGLSGGYGSAGCTKFRNRAREQRYGNGGERHSERYDKRFGEESQWRSEVDHHSGDK